MLCAFIAVAGILLVPRHTLNPNRLSFTGKLGDVTSLGDEYTPAEARTLRVFDRLNSRIGAIIMGAAEDAASGVADQLVKAKGEIDAVVAELQDQAVSQPTIARLQAISQALDDLNVDAPAEPPA